LLRYLPYAADEELEEEIWFGVDGLVKRQPQLCGLLAGHLRDSVPSRRALAACILGHRGDLQRSCLLSAGRVAWQWMRPVVAIACEMRPGFLKILDNWRS
jgi:hypothetical protein